MTKILRLLPVVLVGMLGAAACVGEDAPGGGGGSSGEPSDATSSGSVVIPPGASSSGGSSGVQEGGASSSSSSSSGEVADAYAEPPVDPRCGDTVSLMGPQITQVACGTQVPFDPRVPLVESTYDLDTVHGAAGIGECTPPQEAWQATMAVRESGNDWFLVVTIKVAQGTFSYHLLATVVGENDAVEVRPLCPGGVNPFKDDAFQLRTHQTDVGAKRRIYVSLKHPSTGTVRPTIFIQR